MRVVRVMPNLAAGIGQGATAIAVGAGASFLVAATGMIPSLYGLVLAGLAATGFALICRRRPFTSWALCGAATFALLLAGVHQLLPAYARKFSLRGQVRGHLVE